MSINQCISGIHYIGHIKSDDGFEIRPYHYNHDSNISEYEREVILMTQPLSDADINDAEDDFNKMIQTLSGSHPVKESKFGFIVNGVFVEFGLIDAGKEKTFLFVDHPKFLGINVKYDDQQYIEDMYTIDLTDNRKRLNIVSIDGYELNKVIPMTYLIIKSESMQYAFKFDGPLKEGPTDALCFEFTNGHLNKNAYGVTFAFLRNQGYHTKVFEVRHEDGSKPELHINSYAGHTFGVIYDNVKYSVLLLKC